MLVSRPIRNRNLVATTFSSGGATLPARRSIFIALHSPGSTYEISLMPLVQYTKGLSYLHVRQPVLVLGRLARCRITGTVILATIRSQVDASPNFRMHVGVHVQFEEYILALLML